MELSTVSSTRQHLLDPRYLSARGTPCRERLVIPGPELDALVAREFMQENFESTADPYSTCPNANRKVRQVLEQNGYRIYLNEHGYLTGTLLSDGLPSVFAWGYTYKEVICRAALKLVGVNPP